MVVALQPPSSQAVEEVLQQVLQALEGLSSVSTCPIVDAVFLPRRWRWWLDYCKFKFATMSGKLWWRRWFRTRLFNAMLLFGSVCRPAPPVLNNIWIESIGELAGHRTRGRVKSKSWKPKDLRVSGALGKNIGRLFERAYP